MEHIEDKEKFIKGLSEVIEVDFQASEILNDVLEYEKELHTLIQNFMIEKIKKELTDKQLDEQAEIYILNSCNDEYLTEIGLIPDSVEEDE